MELKWLLAMVAGAVAAVALAPATMAAVATNEGQRLLVTVAAVAGYGGYVVVAARDGTGGC